MRKWKQGDVSLPSVTLFTIALQIETRLFYSHSIVLGGFEEMS
jgi:hypothetical protein